MKNALICQVLTSAFKGTRLARLFHLAVGAGVARPKTSTALFVGAFGQANPAPTVFGKCRHPFCILNERP